MIPFCALTCCNLLSNLFQHQYGYAVYSSGPLNIRSSCFIDNDFFGKGTVILLSSQLHVPSYSNYGTQDNGLICPYLATFSDLAALEAGDEMCTYYDASVCEAQLASTEPRTIQR